MLNQCEKPVSHMDSYVQKITKDINNILQDIRLYLWIMIKLNLS